MMRNFFTAGCRIIVGFVFAATSVSAQETVTNPNIVMDLQWEIGAWTDIWQIGQFESAAARSDVSYYIYLPPGYAKGSRRYPVVYWFHGAYGRPYSAMPVVKRLDAAIRAGEGLEQELPYETQRAGH